MDRLTGARWTFRAIALVCFAVAAASVALTARGGALELVGGLITGALYGAVGWGLWRTKEAAWMLALMVLGLVAALQFWFVVGARDLLLGIGLLVNVGLIIALIWAGRQLPEAQPISTPPAETLA